METFYTPMCSSLIWLYIYVRVPVIWTLRIGKVSSKAKGTKSALRKGKCIIFRVHTPKTWRRLCCCLREDHTGNGRTALGRWVKIRNDLPPTEKTETPKKNAHFFSLIFHQAADLIFMSSNLMRASYELRTQRVLQCPFDFGNISNKFHVSNFKPSHNLSSFIKSLSRIKFTYFKHCKPQNSLQNSLWNNTKCVAKIERALYQPVDEREKRGWKTNLLRRWHRLRRGLSFVITSFGMQRGYK